MFQKPHDVQQSAKSLLKNKDLRKLRVDVEAAFEATADEVEALFPAKVGARSIAARCPRPHAREWTPVQD